MNLQNLFLSKNVKRNSQNDSRSLIKSRSFFTAKPTQSQSKYKGLNFVVNNNQSEKKGLPHEEEGTVHVEEYYRWTS